MKKTTANVGFFWMLGIFYFFWMLVFLMFMVIFRFNDVKCSIFMGKYAVNDDFLMQNYHIILANLDFHAAGTNDNNGYLTVGTSKVHGDFDGRSGTTAFRICCLILGNRTTSKAKDCSTNMVSFCFSHHPLGI